MTSPQGPVASDEEIALDHERSRDQYEVFIRELRRALDEDPAFPHASVLLSKRRVKRYERLLDKVHDLREHGTALTLGNYREFIHDIVGFRYITLTLRDRQTVRRFIESAEEQGVLEVTGPKVMDGLLERAYTGEYRDNAQILDRNTGYTSIHYLVQLRDQSRLPEALHGFRAEVQVRTILEEAWAEVDHRYRYELTRVGLQTPRVVDRGFTHLSHLLQGVASIQEDLCEEAAEMLERGTSSASAQVAAGDPDTERTAHPTPVAGLDRPLLAWLESNTELELELTSVHAIVRMLRDFISDASLTFQEIVDALEAHHGKLRELLASTAPSINFDRRAGFDEVLLLLTYCVLASRTGVVEAERVTTERIQRILAAS